MFFMAAISSAAYALIAPFMPFELKKKNIDQMWVGYIFSIYSCGVIIASPITGKLLPKFGSRTIIRTGVTFMGLSFFFFGACEYIDNVALYLITAMSVRFIEGFATSMMMVSFCSLCTNTYSDIK